jgi:hypothetical protein
MAYITRSKSQKLFHKQQITDLHLKGWTHPMIARELGISEATVKRELRILKQEWRESALEDVGYMKQRELRKLDNLEREALEEWERSKGDFSRSIVETQSSTGTRQRTESGGQTGDPRYLTAIIAIHDRRAKLYGLDAPTKTALTNPDGSALAMTVMPDNQLEARIAELTRKLGMVDEKKLIDVKPDPIVVSVEK